MGKLIVIEGLDGSGKSTQLELLPEKLKEEYAIECVTASFPNYSSDSSALVKMYLSGQFGESADAVNAYAASSFYAVDRFASYKTDWGKFYDAGGTVIAGRYTTSNAVHQTCKLPENEWQDFLTWLYDFEYNKIGIPKPDTVIFLDMPTSISQKLLNNRYSGDGSKKDIHERDVEYLEHCRKAALFTAKYSDWQIIHCGNEDGNPRSIEEINRDIIEKLRKIF